MRPPSGRQLGNRNFQRSVLRLSRLLTADDMTETLQFVVLWSLRYGAWKLETTTLQCRLRRHRSLENLKVCNEYQKLTCKSYVLRVQFNLQRNPKQFWNYVNFKRKSPSIPMSVFLNDTISSAPLEKCELFSVHFSSVFDAKPATPSEVDFAISDVPRGLLDLDFPSYARHGLAKCTFSPCTDGILSAVYCRCMSALADFQ